MDRHLDRYCHTTATSNRSGALISIFGGIEKSQAYILYSFSLLRRSLVQRQQPVEQSIVLGRDWFYRVGVSNDALELARNRLNLASIGAVARVDGVGDRSLRSSRRGRCRGRRVSCVATQNSRAG